MTSWLVVCQKKKEKKETFYLVGRRLHRLRRRRSRVATSRHIFRISQRRRRRLKSRHHADRGRNTKKMGTTFRYGPPGRTGPHDSQSVVARAASVGLVRLLRASAHTTTHTHTHTTQKNQKESTHKRSRQTHRHTLNKTKTLANCFSTKCQSFSKVCVLVVRVLQQGVPRCLFTPLHFQVYVCWLARIGTD